MDGSEAVVGVGCAVLGAVAGGLVPMWVARLPDRYAELAAWSGLRPLAVVLVGVLWGLVGARIGADPAVAAVCYLVLAGTVVGYVDVRRHLLPNAVLLPSYPVVAVLLAIAAAWSGAWGRLAWAAAGGAAMWTFFALLVLVHPAGMGFGDVKLAGLLGLVLGWLGPGHVVLGVFAAFVLGGLTGLVLIVLRRAGRRSAIPFGPFLLAGFLLAVLLGEPIIGWYAGA